MPEEQQLPIDEIVSAVEVDPYYQTVNNIRFAAQELGMSCRGGNHKSDHVVVNLPDVQIRSTVYTRIQLKIFLSTSGQITGVRLMQTVDWGGNRHPHVSTSDGNFCADLSPVYRSLKAGHYREAMINAIGIANSYVPLKAYRMAVGDSVCETCRRVYAVEESEACANCGYRGCPECSRRHCEICDEQSCERCGGRCITCRTTFCATHLKDPEYVVRCWACGRKTCTSCTKHCASCSSPLCGRCSTAACSICGGVSCHDHSVWLYDPMTGNEQAYCRPCFNPPSSLTELFHHPVFKQFLKKRRVSAVLEHEGSQLTLSAGGNTRVYHSFGAGRSIDPKPIKATVVLTNIDAESCAGVVLHGRCNSYDHGGSMISCSQYKVTVAGQNVAGHQTSVFPPADLIRIASLPRMFVNDYRGYRTE